MRWLGASVSALCFRRRLKADDSHQWLGREYNEFEDNKPEKSD